MAKMHRAGIDTYVKTGIIKELMITHIKIWTNGNIWQKNI
jgi:hypothetical protein